MTAASVRAYDALVRFAGFHYLPGSQRATLQRHEPGDARTLVRFTDNGDAHIVRIGKGFRARHVIRCGSWRYATDVEHGVRAWTDDYLPGLQLAASDAQITCAECLRIFDMHNATHWQEWHYGNDCECVA